MLGGLLSLSIVCGIRSGVAAVSDLRSVSPLYQICNDSAPSAGFSKDCFHFLVRELEPGNRGANLFARGGDVEPHLVLANRATEVQPEVAEVAQLRRADVPRLQLDSRRAPELLSWEWRRWARVLAPIFSGEELVAAPPFGGRRRWP